MMLTVTKSTWVLVLGLSASALLACTPTDKILGNIDEGAGAGSVGGNSGGAGAPQGGASPLAVGGTSGATPSPSTGGTTLLATGGTSSGLCFSPTQNLSSAYQAGSRGCSCNPATDADVCVQGVALLCENNRWIAVEDGPCMPQYVAGGSAGTGGTTTVRTATGGSTATGGTPTGGRSTGGSSNTTTCFTPAASIRPGTQGGCACAPGSASVCLGGTGFICSSGYWIAVYDGPCMPVPRGTGGTSNTDSSSAGNGNIGGNGTAGNGGAPATTGTTVAKECGARAGDPCNSDEYCAYQAGQYCGQADAQAICQLRPDSCVAPYSPVCGCDGKTYDNSCDAAMAGTGVYANGTCTQ